MGTPNFAAMAGDYAKHRPEMPAALFERLRTRQLVQPELNVLDLGTGTGTMARGLAREGCQVVGIDREPEMIAAARQRATGELPRIEYKVANAERTDLAEGAFDLVTAANCWDWLNASNVLREAKRLSKGGATVMIVSVDWLPLPGNAIELCENLIADYNGSWHKAGGNGQHPAWLNDLRSGGLENVESMSFDMSVELSHASWRGIVRSSAAVHGSMPANKVIRFDARVASLLDAQFTEPTLKLPCCVWAGWAKFPAATRDQSIRFQAGA